MPETRKQTKEGPFGEVFHEWMIPEYTEHSRTSSWYLLMAIIGVALIIYSIVTVNFLFALIIILAAFIVFIRTYTPSKKVKFQIAEDGIIIGEEYIDYDRIKDFYIIYKPPMIKKLFFDLKGVVADVAIPLENKNPIVIRKRLLEFLNEDLSREHQSLTEQLDNLLKL